MSKKRIGLYAGSFNPFHIGHLDVLRQAERLFDEVILGVGINAHKEGSQVRALAALKHLGLKNQVIAIEGTITSAMKALAMVGDVTLIRGIRNGNDLQGEQLMNSYLRELDSSVAVVYLLPSPNVAHVSSSAIRDLTYVNTPDSLAVVNRLTVKPLGSGVTSYTPPAPPAPKGSLFSSLTQKLT